MNIIVPGLNSQQAESSSSESDSRAPDRTDLLGARGFHVPRPKSRSNTVNSMAVSTYSQDIK